MSLDPWREWQAYLAQFAAGTPFAAGASFAQAAANTAAPGGPAAMPGLAAVAEAAQRFQTSAREFFTAAAAGTGAAAAMQAFTDSLREQYSSYRMPWDPAPARAADTPAFGATREHQQRAQRMADAQRRMADAARRLERLWSDALREAATAYTAGVAAHAMPPTPDSVRKLYDSWIDCAEDAYGRIAHSDEFCAALAEYVNAGSAWRREAQVDAEQWAKILDLPTRSELNTVMQRLRAVEDALRSARDRPASHAPASPAPASAASTRAKRARRKSKS
jgi:ketosteroid isomerase-like protein